MFYQVMPKCRIPSGPVFYILREVATVVMETAQLVLSQFKNFFNVVDWELNIVYPYQ